MCHSGAPSILTYLDKVSMDISLSVDKTRSSGRNAFLNDRLLILPSASSASSVVCVRRGLDPDADSVLYAPTALVLLMASSPLASFSI